MKMRDSRRDDTARMMPRMGEHAANRLESEHQPVKTLQQRVVQIAGLCACVRQLALPGAR